MDADKRSADHPPLVNDPTLDQPPNQSPSTESLLAESAKLCQKSAELDARTKAQRERHLDRMGAIKEEFRTAQEQREETG